MKLSKAKMPSNNKFGYFFSFIFFVLSCYFWLEKSNNLENIFFIISFSFLLITFFSPDLLTPLNKLWMSFGLILGKIVNPIVLGVVFFGLFTPYSIIMRIFGRDELRLTKLKNNTYWVTRSSNLPQTDFKQQF